MKTGCTLSYQESREKLDAIKLLYKEMQELMIALKALGEEALDKDQTSEEFKAIDLRARPIVERYVMLQKLIPTQAELYALESVLLLRDEQHGFLQ